MNRRRFLAAGFLPSLTRAQQPPGAQQTRRASAERERRAGDWAGRPKIDNRIQNVCDPVPYAAQRLDPASYLGRRVDNNFRTGLLRTLDLDDYLRGYVESPRLPPGEYLGKFLQALIRMHLLIGEDIALQRARKIIHTWLKAQKSNGWLGSYQPFESWDIWEHKYVLLGLMDYYALTGEEAALSSARKIGELLCAHLGPELGNIVQAGHWAMGSASILEPMVYLYRHTSERRYLHFCEYILNELEGPAGPGLISILTTGSRRVCDVEDPWANRAAREVRFNGAGQIRNRSKGYEMLSCIIGIARMYQLTGRREYLAVAVSAWKDIHEKRLYLTGSSGADECFKDDHCLPAEATDEPSEACVTAHWIYLSRVLFEITGDPTYADAVEIALYNHLLASQRPQDCYQSYNTPLNGRKDFRLHSLWAAGKPPCCISSTMREIARTPEAIWTKFAANGLGVLIYNQGALEDTIQTSRGPLSLRVEMESAYPIRGDVRLRLEPEREQAFRLALRVPAWAKSFVARAGSRSYRGVPGRFLDLERVWRRGDTVTISMDLNERLVPGGASYPGHFAVMRGPQVLTLTADSGAEDRLDRSAVAANQAPALRPAPEFLPQGWIGQQAYITAALRGAGNCALVPFGEAGQPGKSSKFRTWILAQPGTVRAVPPAPYGLRAAAASPHQIALSWSYRGGNLRGFRLERRRSDVGVWFHVKTTPPGVTTCQDDAVNVVLPGKTYTYRVAAYNEGGLSAYSEEVTVSTPAPQPPVAPSDLRAAAASPTQVNLSWTSHSENEEGFQVERKESEGGEWQLVARRLRAGVTSFRNFALVPGRRYVYRVRAFNAGGTSAWSNEAVVATPALRIGRRNGHWRKLVPTSGEQVIERFGGGIS